MLTRILVVVVVVVVVVVIVVVACHIGDRNCGMKE